MIEFLESADKQLFLFLNGMHNSFLDFIMYWASNRFIWIPFYLFLLIILIKAFGKKTIAIMLLAAAMITISDQVSSSLVKNSVKRLRPCHDPELREQVHLVHGHCGGSYGYFSSHAANSTALAVFIMIVTGGFRRSGLAQPLISQRVLAGMLAAYAFLISYSRIYLGVHFPGDVLTGIVFGSILSFIFARIFFRIYHVKAK